MGWTRIAVIAVDDAWGRAFMRDATDAADEVGVDLALSLSSTLSATLPPFKRPSAGSRSRA